MKINLHIYIGEEKCTACGRKHKKVFEINGKPYGRFCAAEILGRNLTAPAWLYKLADEYAVKEFTEKQTVPTGEESDLESFKVNFWNWADITWSGDQSEHALWKRSVRINGKSVKVDWQHEIAQYLADVYNRQIEKKPEPASSKEEKMLFVIEGVGAVTSEDFGDERDHILKRMGVIWRELKALSIGVIAESFTLGQYSKRAEKVIGDPARLKTQKDKAQKILDLVKEQREIWARYDELCKAN